MDERPTKRRGPIGFVLGLTKSEAGWLAILLTLFSALVVWSTLMTIAARQGHNSTMPY